jgi:FG-GAP repeat protein/IPT/TIG domain-containing protein
MPAPALVAMLALSLALAPLLRGGNRLSPATAGSSRTSPAGLPASARVQASATLGAEQRAFAVTAGGGALRASSPVQGLDARFARAGVRLSLPGINVNLSLRAFGAGAERPAVASAAPIAHANRVSYSRGALTEWYANGPAGLEQGFTVERAPARSTTAPLTLTLALTGGARGTLSPDAHALTLRHGASLLRYGGLLATDASGHALRSWLSLAGGRLSIHVAAAHARYPLTIDPLIEAGNKLTEAPGEQGEGLFGTSVALSADGNTLLVGAPKDANSHRGAAWVFTRSGSAWAQPGVELTGGGTVSTDPEGEEQCAEESSEEAGECAFGASVALSADGNTALIGEPSATALPGSARVFKRSEAGPEWTETMTLPEGGVSRGGRFGKSVALSADGSTALIGDPSANAQRGSAWVFVLSGASSTAQAQLSDSEAGHFDHFGRSVALSGDGDTALIGAPGDFEYRGSTLVFTHSSGAWSRSSGKLTGEAESGAARFGKSVALSGDGKTALVGGQNDHENDGAAWGFTRAGVTFAAQGGKLSGVSGEAGHFGASVALSNNGSIGLVGAPHAGGAGQVTVVEHSGSSWTELATQLAGSGSIGRSWFGSAVSLSSEGKLAAVGGPHDNARIGAAWAFSEFPGSGPAITTVLPGFGPAGTVVRIKGSGFVGSEPAATKVSFGGVPVSSFVVESAVLIEAVAPVGVGTVDVRVQTSEGLSTINKGDNFRYTIGGGSDDKKSAGGGTNAGSEITTTTSSTGAAGGVTAVGGVLGATSSSAAACQVTLRSKHLAVTSFRTVALRLLRTGAGACSGRLTLAFNMHAKGKRPKLKPIGTASYSISAGTSKAFKITLNKAGRKLFRAYRGKLNVSLAILRAVPSPRLAKSASVRLTWKKTHKSVMLTK